MKSLAFIIKNGSIITNIIKYLSSKYKNCELYKPIKTSSLCTIIGYNRGSYESIKNTHLWENSIFLFEFN